MKRDLSINNLEDELVIKKLKLERKKAIANKVKFLSKEEALAKYKHQL
ncbi:MAG: hypothetical protein V1824_03550 [archaeon]